MDRRKIEPPGIAFTIALRDIELALKGGEKALREWSRVNMTLTPDGRGYDRPLRFDGERFSVEYEEMQPDLCHCGSDKHGIAHHPKGDNPHA